MSGRVFIDGYQLFNFNDDDGDDDTNTAMLYIRDSLKIVHPEVETLKEFFFRTTTYFTANSTDLIIIIEPLQNGDVSVIGYMYNDYQSYDFCGQSKTVMLAIHTAMSALFEAFINHEVFHSSINEYSKTEQLKEDRLASAGRSIDEMFKNQSNGS